MVPFVVVDQLLVHEDSGAHQEREVQFVLLEEASADVAVQTEGEMVVDDLHPLREIICNILTSAAICSSCI